MILTILHCLLGVNMIWVELNMTVDGVTVIECIMEDPGDVVTFGNGTTVMFCATVVAVDIIIIVFVDCVLFVVFLDTVIVDCIWVWGDALWLVPDIIPNNKHHKTV